jgi:hypothetical protein
MSHGRPVNWRVFELTLVWTWYKVSRIRAPNFAFWCLTGLAICSMILSLRWGPTASSHSSQPATQPQRKQQSLYSAPCGQSRMLRGWGVFTHFQLMVFPV